MPTIKNVPTSALPKPPPTTPAGGGSSVKTAPTQQRQSILQNEENDGKQGNEGQQG